MADAMDKTFQDGDILQASHVNDIIRQVKANKDAAAESKTNITALGNALNTTAANLETEINNRITKESIRIEGNYLYITID